MLREEPGAGVEVSGLIALGPNVSIETCFATRLYPRLDAGNPAGSLEILKSLAKDIDSLETWLVVRNYFSQVASRGYTWSRLMQNCPCSRSSSLNPGGGDLK